MTTEAVEAQLPQLTMTITRTSAKIVMAAGSSLSSATVGRALRTVSSAMTEHWSTLNEGGQVRIKQLHRLTGGELHQEALADKATVTALSKELRKHGVTFSVEKMPDKTYVLHFSGKDLQSVQHAVNTTLTRISTKVTPVAAVVDRAKALFAKAQETLRKVVPRAR